MENADIGHNPINAEARIKRSDSGIDLVRVLAQEGRRIFSIDDARQFSVNVGIKDAYLAEALYHLRRTGWIIPLRRGLYAISSTTPGVPPAHEFEIAIALVKPAAISHWSAMHHHGLTEQAPHDVFVLTTSGHAVPQQRGRQTPGSRGDFPVNDVLYRFVQVKPERYFGFETIWVGDAKVTITDPERTLLEGLSMPQYCGDFAEVLHGFEARGDRLDVKKILDYALRLDAATVKRLGWVLERHGIAASELRPLRDVLVKGYRKLDPSSPKGGPYDARWMVQENLPGKVTT